jgi:hypothetical protein
MPGDLVENTLELLPVRPEPGEPDADAPALADGPVGMMKGVPPGCRVFAYQ